MAYASTALDFSLKSTFLINIQCDKKIVSQFNLDTTRSAMTTAPVITLTVTSVGTDDTGAYGGLATHNTMAMLVLDPPGEFVAVNSINT